MEDYLVKVLKLYLEKPAMALWRACELGAIYPVLASHHLPISPSLEIGCGDGRLSRVLFGKSMIDVGLDISYLEATQARKTALYKRTVISDVTDTRLNSGYFKFLFSNSTIEHFSDINLALDEMSRVTCRDGFLLTTVPTASLVNNQLFSRFLNWLNFKGLSKKYGILRNERLGHRASLTVENWVKIIESHGYTVVEHKTYLAPSTTFWWDIVSYFDFLVRFLHVDFLIRHAPAWCSRVYLMFWYKLLKNAYTKDLNYKGGHGSCVLILSRKI